jgi:hypothetical protein
MAEVEPPLAPEAPEVREKHGVYILSDAIKSGGGATATTDLCFVARAFTQAAAEPHGASAAASLSMMHAAVDGDVPVMLAAPAKRGLGDTLAVRWALFDLHVDHFRVLRSKSRHHTSWRFFVLWSDCGRGRTFVAARRRACGAFRRGILDVRTLSFRRARMYTYTSKHTKLGFQGGACESVLVLTPLYSPPPPACLPVIVGVTGQDEE